MEVLRVKDLAVYFGEGEKEVRAIDYISFSVDSGEILGIVGESGSGKTITALSILRLLPPTARIISGEIIFQGENLLSAAEQRMLRIRGEKIILIPQDPTSSLNPVISAGEQIKEVIEHHRKDVKKKDRKRLAIDLLKRMKIPDAEKRFSNFPHQLSGGMNQRVIIAMAFSTKKPALIIADEPTTALDVTVQKKILDDLISWVKEAGISLIFITHNLGLVAEYADRVLVMREGKIVEQGKVFDVFSNPQDPYTKHLLEVVPKLGGKKK